jgi:hypothetical protein
MDYSPQRPVSDFRQGRTLILRTSIYAWRAPTKRVLWAQRGVWQDPRENRRQRVYSIGLARFSREARLRSTSFHSEVAQPLTPRYSALYRLQITKGESPLFREAYCSSAACAAQKFTANRSCAFAQNFVGKGKTRAG